MLHWSYSRTALFSCGVTFAGGDVNGDGVVDIIFSIDGAHKLVKGDFDL